jgi:Flp pilus assembly pilin Flp
MHYVRLVHSLFVRLHDAEGQALAEYVIILGLVFVAAAVSLALLGGAVSTSFADFIDAAGFGGS